MKRLLTLALLLMTLTLGMAAKESTQATVVFTVTPKMSCQNCENKIKSNLRFEKGIKSIDTSLTEQTVKVVYNPKKASVESIQKGFAKIGYTAIPKEDCDDSQNKKNEAK